MFDDRFQEQYTMLKVGGKNEYSMDSIPFIELSLLSLLAYLIWCLWLFSSLSPACVLKPLEWQHGHFAPTTEVLWKMHVQQ